MNNKKNKSKEYTNDLVAWQDNMYQPGKYLGSDIPLDVKYGGKKFGYFVLIQGLIIFGVGVLILLYSEETFLASIFLILGLVTIYVGYKKVLNDRE